MRLLRYPIKWQPRLKERIILWIHHKNHLKCKQANQLHLRGIIQVDTILNP